MVMTYTGYKKIAAIKGKKAAKRPPRRAIPLSDDENSYNNANKNNESADYGFIIVNNNKIHRAPPSSIMMNRNYGPSHRGYTSTRKQKKADDEERRNSIPDDLPLPDRHDEHDFDHPRSFFEESLLPVKRIMEWVEEATTDARLCCVRNSSSRNNEDTSTFGSSHDEPKVIHLSPQKELLPPLLQDESLLTDVSFLTDASLMDLELNEAEEHIMERDIATPRSSDHGKNIKAPKDLPAFRKFKRPMASFAMATSTKRLSRTIVSHNHENNEKAKTKRSKSPYPPTEYCGRTHAWTKKIVCSSNLGGLFKKKKKSRRDRESKRNKDS